MGQLYYLAIRCESPEKAFSVITNANWSVSDSEMKNFNQEREAILSEFNYIYGDEIRFECMEGYMFSNNMTAQSFVCSQNGTDGIWKPVLNVSADGCLGIPAVRGKF